MQKGQTLIFLLVAMFIAIFIGVLFYVGKQIPNSLISQNDQNSPIPRACTEEAKICPDGSAVGRVGPNCEFAPCPSSNKTDETANWKTYTNSTYGYSFKYPSGWIIVRDTLFDGNIISSVKSPLESSNSSQLRIEIHSGDLSYERYAYFYHLHSKGLPKNLGQVSINGWIWDKFSNNEDLSSDNNLYVLGTTKNNKKYFLIKQIDLRSKNAKEDSKVIEQMIQTFSLAYNK